MNENENETFAKIISGAVGASTPTVLVGVLGVPGFSAAGITSGLATLGVGSMAIGLLAVPVIGVVVGAGVYSLLKK